MRQWNRLELPANYSGRVVASLVGMVLVGASKTTVTKIYFQLDIGDPLFATLLILAAQACAIPLHGLLLVYDKLSRRHHLSESSSHRNDSLEKGRHPVDLSNLASRDHSQDVTSPDDTTINATDYDQDATITVERIQEGNPSPSLENSSQKDVEALPSSMLQSHQTTGTTGTHSTHRRSVILACLDDDFELSSDDDEDSEADAEHPKHHLGSLLHSHARHVSFPWLKRIPWKLQPLVLAGLALFEVTFRMLYLFYLPASVASLLSQGLSLVVTVLASKWLRGRHLSVYRWMGTAVVLGSLLVQGSASFVGSTQDQTESFPLGILFIILKSLVCILCQMASESLLQDELFPVTLLLGMQGLYALLMAIPLYAILTQFLPIDSGLESLRTATGDPTAVVLTLLVMSTELASGLMGILCCALTSTVTRSTWKNMRGLMVWIFAIIVYYAGGHRKELGEAWDHRSSPLILGGAALSFAGLYVYYMTPKKAASDGMPK